ncbi:hypothetical protein PIIN_00293 [Serendipita indica DSM 11827]|uniref:Pre-rRNA-processing protein RIX1 n=1 Tax=Serendipita indica (strain DSM 11827) TaxID=1109443 RepID=G4T5M7_SERID|nr:hypothetical protein PIIN_00293 [Serendipita indica DSM 11827]
MDEQDHVPHAIKRRRSPLGGNMHCTKTGHFRKDLLTEYAQRWINLTLPLLSKTEPHAIWKASIDLLVFIFVNTTHLAEFRRQVSTPTVPKLTTALLELLSKADDSLKVMIMNAISSLIQWFPTLHRALGSTILAAVTPHLAGNMDGPSLSIVDSAAHLLAVMHRLDGKVGAPIAWRTTLDATLAEAWHCLEHITGKAVQRAPVKKPFTLPSLPEDPLVAVCIAYKRLSNMVKVMEAMLSANPARAVLVPVAELARLCIHLLHSIGPNTSQTRDLILMQLERQISPELVSLGAKLAATLASSLRHNLIPHATSILTSFAFHLEQDPSPATLNMLLSNLVVVLDHTATHSTLLPARLFRAIVPRLSPLLPKKQAIESINSSLTKGSVNGEPGSSRKNKKGRQYEGEELLGPLDNSNELEDPERATTVLLCVDVLERVFREPYLSASLHSLGSRLIIALQLHLTTHPLANPPIGGSLAFSTQLQAKLVQIQGHLLLGVAGHAPRGTNHFVSTLSICDPESLVAKTSKLSLDALDSILHPRMPPAVRPLPKAESLMLFRLEEGKEEREERERLSLDHGFGMDVEIPTEPILTAPATVVTAVDIEGPQQQQMEVVVESNVGGERAIPRVEKTGPSMDQLAMPTTGTSNLPQVTEPQSQASFGFITKPPELESVVPALPAFHQQSGPQMASSALVPARENRPSHAGDISDEDLPSINMESDSDSE